MTPAALPIFVVPLTFLFVLLIILIAKAPKAGAWVVGGLLVLAPVLLYRFAAAGAFAHADAIPLFVVPVTFLFVLLVIVLAKAPRAGAALIGALVAVGLAAVFVAVPVSHRRATPAPTDGPHEVERIGQQTEHGLHGLDRVVVNGEFERVFEEYVQAPSAGVPILPSPPAPRAMPAPAPIWSEGVEQEFEADVYPSDVAAARALGRRVAGSIPKVAAGDPNATIDVVLFQEGNDRSLMTAFARAMEKELPGVRYAIEADLRNIDPGEVGLTLRVDERKAVASAGSQDAYVVHDSYVVKSNGGGLVQLKLNQTASDPADSGRIVATAFSGERRASAEARFVQKPWIENFGAFASERPGQTFVVARSNATCTSESEANQQALDNACALLAEPLGQYAKKRFPQLRQPEITTKDVLQGDFVVDRFAQSFGTSTGRVWRQALLIHLSGPKLARLGDQKAVEMDSMRMSWARMGFSVIGVLVLIGVIYFFLNMATMGYYEWSLRIAGVVLAIIAIVSILMIVK